MNIVFHGAAQTVTGSMHEIQIPNPHNGTAHTRLLFDCGLFQGRRDEARKRNSSFPFNPPDIHAVVLTHAHLDHCGNLPNLVKQGFRGPIYATKATAAISALILLDAAKIQEEDAAYLNQKSQKNWNHTIQPLYTLADAEKTIERFQTLDYRKPLALENLEIELRDAGHVLGSAAVRLREKTTPINTPSPRRIIFTGDIGRKNSPVVQNPDPFDDADALLMECTYGGRRHGPVEAAQQQLAQVLAQTAQRGGWTIIPAFALGRTQALIQQIHELRNAKRVPGWLPIYVDSPLACRLTETFRRFPNLWDDQTRALAQPFDFPNLVYVGNIEESKTLNYRSGPGVIIAGSGMCEAGRILHHLKHHIRNPQNTVMMAGYQAPYTLGRKIADRWPNVPILGDFVPLRCRVETIDGLSAHADGPELVEYISPLQKSQPRVFLVHGEPPACQAMQKDLIAAGFTHITIPTPGQKTEI